MTEYNLYLIVVPRPDYGASSCLKPKSVFEYALALGELISSLGFKRFNALGLSAGAPYCYALATAYPDRVGTVSICSGVPLMNNADIYLVYKSYIRQPRFLVILQPVRSFKFRLVV